jgi:hypothetical protein
MTTVRTIFHPPTAEDCEALNTLTAGLTLDYLRGLGATITIGHIGGRGPVAVASLGNLQTPLRQHGDGRYTPDHPEVIYAFEAASVSQDEAERLHEPVVEPDAALVF